MTVKKPTRRMSYTTLHKKKIEKKAAADEIVAASEKICLWQGCTEKATKPPGKKMRFCLEHFRQYHREDMARRRKGETINKKTPGRKPSKAREEKDTELILLGQQDFKGYWQPYMGKKLTPYDSYPEHIKFTIDCSALGYTAGSIVGLMKEKYGEGSDKVLTIQKIIAYQKRFIDDIERRRKELRVEIPIISPVARLHYLQEVVTKGLDGVTKYTKTGEQYTDYELGVVIQAVKEMNSMQKVFDDQMKLSEQEMKQMAQLEEEKRVIREYIAEMKAKPENEGKTDMDILKMLTPTLIEDYEASVKELEEEIKNIQNGTGYVN